MTGNSCPARETSSRAELAASQAAEHRPDGSAASEPALWAAHGRRKAMQRIERLPPFYKGSY